MVKRKKTNPWFIKVRGSYLPNSWQGWLLYIPFTAYLVGALVYAWGSGESLFRVVFGLVTQFMLAGIIMTWIAAAKSQ